MAVTRYDLSATFTDLLGAAFDPTTAKVIAWVETNVANTEGIVDEVGNAIHLGGARKTADAAGAITWVDLIGSDSTPADINLASGTLQYRVTAEYRSEITRRRERWVSGWFSLAADINLADVISVTYVPAAWMTDATATLQALVDSAGIKWRNAWNAATAYAVADAVSYGGASYRRLVAGTTATAPNADATNWGTLAAQGAPGPGSAAWAAAEVVVVGTVRQAPDGSWIKSTAGRTTGATFDATEQAFWTAATVDTGWNEVGAAGQPAFQNGWVNYDAVYNTAAFRKIDNRVHLKGLVKNGTNFTTIFTLPTGYRPITNNLFGVASNDAFGRVDINQAGSASAMTPSSNAYISLDGISFSAD